MPVTDVSLKNTWHGAKPFADAYVKFAEGGGDAVIVCAALVELPYALLTVSVVTRDLLHTNVLYCL